LSVSSGPITPRRFQEADGVGDWRVVADGACVLFRTESFAAGVALVDAIGRLAAAADRQPDDPQGRGPSLWFQEMDGPRPPWWTLADAEGNEADVATWAGRD